MNREYRIKGKERMKLKKQKNEKRLNGKDLINIGIFTALNLVIGVVTACTIGMMPMGFMILAPIGPVILGIPMMLYFSRIKKFGMILILQIVIGIVMILTGMGTDSLLYGTLVALLSELILMSGAYKSGNRIILTYAVFSLAACANYIHWINASAKWLEETAATFGETYVYTISGYFSHSWVFPALLVSAFVGGLLGGMLGKTVLKKHFMKSGLA